MVSSFADTGWLDVDKALIHQKITADMQSLTHYDISWLQKYMETEEMGPWALTDADSDIWSTIEKTLLRAKDIWSPSFQPTPKPLSLRMVRY
jgi:hypothetical protein